MFRNWSATINRPWKIAFVFIGVLAVIGGQTAFSTWYMNNLRAKVITVSVVRAKAELPPHKLIQASDVELAKVQIDDTVKGYISDIDDVVGKELNEAVAEREQLTPEKIGIATKKEGEITVQIPTDWVMSFPQSMRSWDHIAMWEVLDKDAVKRLSTQETEKAIATTTIGGQTVSAGTNEIDTSDNQGLSPEPFLKDIVVAYFKDSASNDVEDQRSEDVPRETATSVGTKIEVNVTPEQFAMMREKADQGYKFVIGYY